MSTITVKVVIVNDADGMTLERSDITQEIEGQGLAAAVKIAMGEAVSKCTSAFADSHIRVLRLENEALEVDAAKAEIAAKAEQDIVPVWADYEKRLAALNAEFREAGIKRRLIKQTIAELEKGERRRGARF